MPQNRERVFCVSIRKDVDDEHFKFNEPFDNRVRLKDILEDNVDEKYYISEQMLMGFIEKNKQGSFKNRFNPRTIEEQNGIATTITTREGNVITSNWVANRIGGMFDGETKHQAGSIWDTNGISPTLDTMQGGYRQPCVFQKYRIRKLTPKECFRLMGLTDEEIQKIQDAGISNSQQYKMAGNSIVVDQMFFLKNLF